MTDPISQLLERILGKEDQEQTFRRAQAACFHHQNENLPQPKTGDRLRCVYTGANTPGFNDDAFQVEEGQIYNVVATVDNEAGLKLIRDTLTAKGVTPESIAFLSVNMPVPPLMISAGGDETVVITFPAYVNAFFTIASPDDVAEKQDTTFQVGDLMTCVETTVVGNEQFTQGKDYAIESLCDVHDCGDPECRANGLQAYRLSGNDGTISEVELPFTALGIFRKKA